MTSFLSEVGAFGQGFAPALDKIYQDQQNNALGDALAAKYGGLPPGAAVPQSQSPFQSLMSNLTGGGQQGQFPVPQMPPLIPQGGPPNVQTAPPVQPVAQMGPRAPQVQGPMTAQPAGGLPAQPQLSPQPPPQPPPQPAPAPSQGPPVRQPPAQQGQAQQPQFDVPTLVQALVQRGVTGHRLVNALNNATPLLNVIGLQQYHQLGLQLRSEDIRDREAQREFDRSGAPGSRSSNIQSEVQNREANQRMRQEGLDNIESRFEKRQAAALDKLKNAKTGAEVKTARDNLSKVAADLDRDLKSQLSILNTPGTSEAEKQAATQRAGEIRQQLDDATDEAVKARRSAGASGEQVGGAKPAPEVVQGKQVSTPHVPGATMPGPDGKTYRFKGGDWDAQESWEPVQ